MLSSPLEEVGSADLSANVDFDRLASAFPDRVFRKIGPMTQSRFLQTYGINERLSRLLSGATRPEQGTLMAGADMLLSGDKMGQTYKAFMAVAK